MRQKAMPAGKIDNPPAPVSSPYAFCHFPSFVELFSGKRSRPSDRPRNFIEKAVAGKK
jgi:hypothetical protein